MAIFGHNFVGSLASRRKLYRKGAAILAYGRAVYQYLTVVDFAQFFRL